ncbi:BID domain-containing T4SS effector [Bartonella elizabethae]|uniref:BID domain-containing T4SS effector n=1 Tax=Bartonella elizabethae TaxID=807 RepID=UPI0009993EA1|nr:BID domain-containing T4SS effector [Bartonella elizabethae]
MKKKHPSPFIAEMMEKLQQKVEQSPTRTPPPPISPKPQKPSIQKRPENLPPSPKVAPPPPPRVRASMQTSVNNQETPPLQTKVAPPKPPRAKDRQQHSLQVESSPTTQKRMAPPPPLRGREKTPTDVKIQKPETFERPSAPIKAAPQRPPRAKDREQHSPHVQASPSATKRMAPPPPPRVREKTPTGAKIQKPEPLAPSVRPKTPQHRTVRQQSSSSSQDSEIYAVPRSNKPLRKGSRKQSDAVVQKTASPQTAMRQPKPSQEQKASINTMERELLLGAYQEEIRFLCGKVYGDRLILEQKIAEIKENPTMGEQLLWDMKENPLSISKLAGRKVLGIKSDARKQAEETLPALQDAIEGFLYTSKYAKENILQSAHGEQRQHQHTQQEETITQHTQSRLNSERKIQPLSNQEIARRVQQDPSVQYGQREVQYWCQIVYKDPFVLQYRMEDMHKIPEMGEELVFQIEKDPTSFAPLAGRKALGIKNGARKAAEENLPTLCTAIKDYGETIKQLRETIVQNHQIEQQQRHQPLSDLDKKLQKQQSLSETPQLPERSTTKRRQELSETSRKEEHSPIRPRRSEASKAMALS